MEPPPTDSEATRTAPPPRAGVLRNVSWLVGANVLIKPLWFAFSTYACINLLTVEDFGLMVWGLALAAVVLSFSDLGATVYATREVARAPEVAGLIFTHMMVARAALVLVILAGLTVWGAAWGWTPAERGVALAAGVYAAGEQGINHTRAYFRAFEVMRYEAGSVVAEKALVVAGGFAALVLTRSPVATLGGMALGMLLAFGGTAAVVVAQFAGFRAALLRRADLVRLARGALPLGVFGILVLIFGRVGILFLKEIHGADATATYGAAYRIVEAILVMAGLLAGTIMPRITRLASEGAYAEAQRLMRRVYLGLGAGAGLFALGVIATAPFILRLLTGADQAEAYAEAVPLLRLLILIVPIMGINGAQVSALVALHDQRYLVRFFLVLTPLAVLAYYAGAAAYAATGIAVVLIGLELIVLIGLGYRVRARLRAGRAQQHRP